MYFRAGGDPVVPIEFFIFLFLWAPVHLIPNMRHARVYEGMYIWLQVAKTLTREEHDEAWSKPQQPALYPAKWLQDSLLPREWHQSEIVHLGRPTFNCSTNNVANEIATLLFDQQFSALHSCPTNNLENEINGNEIKIRFLKINFIRCNLPSRPIFQVFLSIHGNVIMKNENALSTAHPQCSNFREEVVW
jgi:hypothetical protein